MCDDGGGDDQFLDEDGDLGGVATAGTGVDLGTCSNCGLPTDPDTWCRNCGFYPAIGGCVDLAEWEQGIEQDDGSEAKHEPQQLVMGIPLWAWQLAGGILLVVIVTLVGHFLHPPRSSGRTTWAISESVVGLFAFLFAHIRFAISALSRDKDLGIVDVVASPLRIWIEAMTEFHKTFPLIAVGTTGFVGIALAHTVLGIPYLDMVNLDPPPKKKKTSVLAAAAKMAPGGRGRDMTLEEAMGELADQTGANDLDATDQEDEEEGLTKQEVSCLVVGYLPKGDADLARSLVVAVQMNGKWRVIGTVAVPPTGDLAEELRSRFEGLRTDRPAIRCNYPAIWLKPKLQCVIEVAYGEGDTKPRSMKLVDLL